MVEGIFWKILEYFFFFLIHGTIIKLLMKLNLYDALIEAKRIEYFCNGSNFIRDETRLE